MQVVLDRRVWKVLGVFSIYELTLAVCRDYFSASQVLALVDCLPEGHMQPLVVRASRYQMRTLYALGGGCEDSKV